MNSTPLVERQSNTLSEEEFNQVLDFVYASRQGDSNANWFMNSFKPGLAITKSGRGEFAGENNEIWIPFENENQPCCKGHEGTVAEPYRHMAHCQTLEHVTNLVNSLNNRDIKKEFTAMLNALADTISGIGEE